MAKKIRKKHSKAAVGEYAVTAASSRGEHDGAGEDMMDYDGEAGDGRMFDSEDEHETVPDVDDGKGAAHWQAEHDKTAKQPRKKKQHGKEGTGDTVNPAEDGDFERPRKRHRPRSSDASPGRSRSASADSASPVPSSPVSSSREQPAESQSLLDHQPHTPTPPPPPPPSLQRFPLPSRPHAPEKAELASQGLDRALAGAQLVDPLLSTPLSPDKDGNDITGLSAKMLRRLRDLGIEELFAGVYRVPLYGKLIFRMYKLSPDYAAAVAPPFRTSEAVPVPPI
jgi:hypothetical protein